MKKTKKYNTGKIPRVWDLMVQLHKTNPAAFENASLLKYYASQQWVSLKDETRCPNCGESMMEYVHKLDFFNALLLKKMGDVVLRKMAHGMDFTQANMVHVVTSDFHDCVRHRTTQCKTLGLIAKVKNEKGGHNRDKGWLITDRGFTALRGEPVPAEVTVFRNNISERSDLKKTLEQVFAEYKGENRGLVGDRDPMEWVHFAGFNSGKIL